MHALNELRDEIIPATVGQVPRHDASTSAATRPARRTSPVSSTSRLPLIFAFVFGLAFLLMLVTFRSIVIPIKAIILNLLSVGAAYGVLVLVFQNGHGESLLGFTSIGGVANWLPLFLFVVLFGLSMDYHVFILSRVRELYDRGMSTDEAVKQGISTTAGTVTSAAVVMVGVFAVFVTLTLPRLQGDGARAGRRRPDRRDDHPRRAAARLDEAARRLELVPARAGSSGCRKLQAEGAAPAPLQPAVLVRQYTGDGVLARAVAGPARPSVATSKES